MRRALILTMIFGVALAFVIGCSDDENPVTPDDLQTGDLSDASFIAAHEALYTAEEFSGEFLDWMDVLIDTVFEDSATLSSSGKTFDPTIASDSVLVAYHEASSYWYFYLSLEDTTYGTGQTIEDIVTLVLEDSIQFLHGDVAVQWPDSVLLDGVNNGAILTISTQSGLGNAVATQDVNIVGAIADRGDVTLNGTRSFDLIVSDEGGSCSVSLDGDATATDVFMNVTEMDADGCPMSGNLVHVGTITIECTGDTTFTFSDTWTFDQTFFGDTTQVVVENTTTRWTYTDTCGASGGITKPYTDLFAKIRER